jgi:hypothetical protein
VKRARETLDALVELGDAQRADEGGLTLYR